MPIKLTEISSENVEAIAKILGVIDASNFYKGIVIAVLVIWVSIKLFKKSPMDRVIKSIESSTKQSSHEMSELRIQITILARNTQDLLMILPKIYKKTMTEE